MDHRVQRVTGSGPEVGTGAVTVERIRTAGGDGAVALTDGRAVRSPSAAVRAGEAMSRFDDQVAIVTGAGSGTGAAIATQLAEEGASIFCTDLDGAEQTAALLGERGRAVRLDVADAGSVARLMTEVRETHGRLDALFNCADRWQVRPLDGAFRGELRARHAGQPRGPFLMMKHAIPLMVEGGGGAIVNVSATLALAATPGFAHPAQRPRPGCYSSPRRQRWSTARAVCA